MNIQRRFRFAAAHALNFSGDARSTEKDFETFGKCAQIHGHNFELWVTLNGATLDERNMIVDLDELKAAVAPIIELLDHTFLNENDWVKANCKAPYTCEALANALVIEIAENASKDLKASAGDFSVRLIETENNEFETTYQDAIRAK